MLGNSPMRMRRMLDAVGVGSSQLIVPIDCNLGFTYYLIVQLQRLLKHSREVPKSAYPRATSLCHSLYLIPQRIRNNLYSIILMGETYFHNIPISSVALNKQTRRNTYWHYLTYIHCTGGEKTHNQ